MAEKPTIAYIDIETSPSLGWVWGVWEQNVLEIEQDWYLLSFAVKINDGKTKVYALPDYKGYKRDRRNDKALVRELWNVLDSADIIIAHNGDRFDLRKANARFIAHGLTPPAPYKSVDTLKIARKHFMFDSNRLDNLARYLNIGRKLETGGKDTWLGCMRGDKHAWEVMKEYNAHDVELLYEVHKQFVPWATTYPNMAVYVGRDGVCPHCGKDKLQKRGASVTKTGYRQRYQCTSCGAWSSDNKIERVTRIS